MTSRQITHSAILLVLLIICSKISFALGWIPISIQTFAVMVIAQVTHPKQAGWIYFIYIILGLIGMPVFSGSGAGLSVFLSPSFGFVLGFYPMTLVIQNLLLHFPKGPKLLFLLIGNIILYIIGIFYMGLIMTKVLSLDITFLGLLKVGFFPFIIGDLLKIVLANKFVASMTYFKQSKPVL